MTLQAYDKKANTLAKQVALPLEFVDWMYLTFSGRFIKYMASISPYDSVLVPESLIQSAKDELVTVRDAIHSGKVGAFPKRLEICTEEFGRAGALRTAKELIEFFDFASSGEYKVVSNGD